MTSESKRVVLTEPRLLSALTDGGAPCTVAEIKQRFDGFVTELTKGKDVARVRFVIEKNDRVGASPNIS